MSPKAGNSLDNVLSLQDVLHIVNNGEVVLDRLSFALSRVLRLGGQVEPSEPVDVLEVSVEREKLRTGLHRVRRDPDIVRRYRASFSSQGRGNARVSIRRDQVDRHQGHVGTIQKEVQATEIMLVAIAVAEPVEQLPRYDRGDDYGL